MPDDFSEHHFGRDRPKHPAVAAERVGSNHKHPSAAFFDTLHQFDQDAKRGVPENDRVSRVKTCQEDGDSRNDYEIPILILWFQGMTAYSDDLQDHRIG